MQSLGLYVHIPWCVRKCPYCDFNSHEAKSFPEAEYVARLRGDMEAEAARGLGQNLTSVFFGGGTPSLFSPGSIAEILTAADRLLGLSGGVEVTLEANPGTADAANFRGYHAAGVNRLSLGVQSFDDRCLEALGRIHSAADALGAIQMAWDSGFDNVNIDLMHGLPAQNVALAEIGRAHV